MMKTKSNKKIELNYSIMKKNKNKNCHLLTGDVSESCKLSADTLVKLQNKQKNCHRTTMKHTFLRVICGLCV